MENSDSLWQPLKKGKGIRRRRCGRNSDSGYKGSGQPACGGLTSHNPGESPTGFSRKITFFLLNQRFDYPVDPPPQYPLTDFASKVEECDLPIVKTHPPVPLLKKPSRSNSPGPHQTPLLLLSTDS